LINQVICDGGAFIDNTKICNNLPTAYSNLCPDGVLNQAQFCNTILGGTLEGGWRCVFGNGNTIDPPTNPDPCITNPTPECSIAPPPPDTCATDVSLCDTPDIGMDTCNMNPPPAGCPDSGSNNRQQKISISSNAYVAYFLANYELFKEYDIGLAIECGLGAIYRDITLKGAVSGSSSATTLAAKTGAVGSYYFADNLALGLGVYYVYMGDTQLKVSNYDFKMRNSATITYSMQLRYLF
jgi:hypothetical protein